MTPTVTAWAVAIAINVVHVIVQATLAYRYLVVAPEVPEQPVPRQAPRPPALAGPQAETRC